MSLADLQGVSFGPYPYRTSVAKVAEYVEATRDDIDRWSDTAPPSLAGALLFVVAPHLLSDPRIHGRSVIHGDQTFSWHRPILAEDDLSVTGTVSKVRERSGVFLITFDLGVEDGSGPVLAGSSTFLMAGSGSPASRQESEPPPDESGPNDVVRDGDTTPLRRSASRSDLVRYAGASRDFNPIHWDHAAALAAGLPGVVVHGLLQSAWVCQAAGRLRPGAVPIATARFRFKSPLRPGAAAEVVGEVSDPDEVALSLTSGGTVVVASTLRLGPR